LQTYTQNIAIALIIFVFSAVAAPDFHNSARAGTTDVGEALEIRSLGDPNAPVTLTEYSSLGCPHCKSFHENTLPTLKKEYIDTGKVRLIYRDFPLGSRAMAAAMLTRCAPKTLYFGMLELFFDKQAVWSQSEDAIGALSSVAKHGMMTNDDVLDCLQKQELMDGVRSIKEDGTARFDIESTPTFVINNDADLKIEGAADIEEFRKALDEALN
jgi:protein-disulfide isomerase